MIIAAMASLGMPPLARVQNSLFLGAFQIPAPGDHRHSLLGVVFLLTMILKVFWAAE